jgi:hypothetical protein
MVAAATLSSGQLRASQSVSQLQVARPMAWPCSGTIIGWSNENINEPLLSERSGRRLVVPWWSSSGGAFGAKNFKSGQIRLDLLLFGALAHERLWR